MIPIWLRNAARWLLVVVLALLLLWLALPRLLGLAAERWLNIPGLEAVHVEVKDVGAGHARVSELRGVYQSSGGHRFGIALHDITLDYSLMRRHVERLVIANAELEILAGQPAQVSAWPQFEWPDLPLSDAHIRDLRVVVDRPEHRRLEARGDFRWRQTASQLQVEFRPAAALLRLTASHQDAPGNAVEVHAEWLPATGPGGDARLTLGRLPTQQPASLVAQVPLPVLVEVARILGVAAPLSAAGGTLTLTAEAQLGDSAGTFRTLSGEAEFTAARLQVTAPVGPLDLAFAGKLNFAWQPATARLELQPGVHWQATVDGDQPLQASGRLERIFAIRLADGGVASAGEFPFALRSPQWGQWEGSVQRVGLKEGADLTDWSAADVQTRIKGQLKQWQQDAIQVRDVQAAGDMVLHWSRSAGVRGTLALQLSAGRLSSTGNSPFTLGRSTWTISAEGAAKAGGDLWNSVVLTGQASSPQLKMELGSGQALTLGPSRLQLLQLKPTRRQGAQGELLFSADAIRMGSGPSPNLRARLRLDGSALHADGTLLLQKTEVLRFAGSHALARGCGDATLTAHQSLSALGKLLQPRPPALYPLDFQAGEADARFTLNWCTQPSPRFNVTGTLQAHDVALGWERARVESLQTTLRLDGLYPLEGRIQLAARRGELATVTPMTDLNVDLALAAKSLMVHALDVKLLGGRVHSEPLSLPWPPSEQTLPLEIRHIDLGQLFALFTIPGLSGSGQLDGLLPLTYRHGSVEILDGQLNSDGAGIIRYAPALAISDNPGLQALRNFHFQQFGAHVWYAADGEYRTQAKLEGSNPDFYNGYPIRFGLNINGKLPGLFRAALFSGDFNRHILEQLQSGKLE